METTFKIANIHAKELEEAIELHEIKGLASKSEGKRNTKFIFEDITGEGVGEVYRLIDNIESREN